MAPPNLPLSSASVMLERWSMDHRPSSLHLKLLCLSAQASAVSPGASTSREGAVFSERKRMGVPGLSGAHQAQLQDLGWL